MSAPKRAINVCIHERCGPATLVSSCCAERKRYFSADSPSFVIFRCKLARLQKRKRSQRQTHAGNAGCGIGAGAARSHVILAIFPASETFPDVSFSISSTYNVSASCTTDCIVKSVRDSAGAVISRFRNSPTSNFCRGETNEGCVGAVDAAESGAAAATEVEAAEVGGAAALDGASPGPLGAAASFRPLFFACCILRQCSQLLQHHFIFTAVHLIASHTLPPPAGQPPFAHTPPDSGCHRRLAAALVTSFGCAGLCTIVGDASAGGRG